MDYALDAAGNTTDITWPTDPLAEALTASYDYDDMNRVSAIRNGTSSYAAYGYDDLSRRTGVTLGNGRTSALTYWAASTLKTLTQPNLIDTDANGTGDATATWSFAYNRANRMKGAMGSDTGDCPEITPRLRASLREGRVAAAGNTIVTG